jgi:hypothetical protein
MGGVELHNGPEARKQLTLTGSNDDEGLLSKNSLTEVGSPSLKAVIIGHLPRESRVATDLRGRLPSSVNRPSTIRMVVKVGPHIHATVREVGSSGSSKSSLGEAESPMTCH